MKSSLPGLNRPVARRSEADSGISWAACALAEGLSPCTSPPSWALAAVTSKATGLAPALSENDMAPPSRSTSSMATAHEGALVLLLPSALASAFDVATGGGVATPWLTIQRSYIQRLPASRSTCALGWINWIFAALKDWPGRSMSTCVSSTFLTDTREIFPCASSTSLTAISGAVTCRACGLSAVAACQLRPSRASSWPFSAGSRNWPIYLAAMLSGQAATTTVPCAAWSVAEPLKVTSAGADSRSAGAALVTALPCAGVPAAKGSSPSEPLNRSGAPAVNGMAIAEALSATSVRRVRAGDGRVSSSQ